MASENPLDERVVGQLMLALYRAGRQADALAHYQHTRQHLAEELGTNPGPRLQQLHQRILTTDPTLIPAAATSASAEAGPSVVPQQLPAAPWAFTGRTEHLATLTATLERRGTVVISAIHGAGGIGKTWLALAWAHRHVDRFPDGQLFVDLRGFSPDSKTAAAAGGGAGVPRHPGRGRRPCPGRPAGTGRAVAQPGRAQADADRAGQRRRHRTGGSGALSVVVVGAPAGTAVDLAMIVCG